MDFERIGIIPKFLVSHVQRKAYTSHVQKEGEKINYV